MEKKKIKFYSVDEEVIYNRGVSAGYFNLDIEVTRNFDERKQYLYDEGLKYGTLKKRQLLKSDEDTINYYMESRNSYLRNLGVVAANGGICVNVTKLKESEYKYFNEGVQTSVIKAKTPSEVKKVRNRK